MLSAKFAVLQVLSDNGQEVTLEIPSETRTYDPATGTYTYGTPTTQVVMGYPSEYKSTEVNRGTILEGESRFLLAAVDTSGVDLTAPVVGTTIKGVGGDKRVVTTQALSEEAEVFCYICKVSA